MSDETDQGGRGAARPGGMSAHMAARTRTAVTLAVLAVIVVAAVGWGLSRVSAPFSDADEGTASTCTDQTFSGSDRVRPSDVAVSVLNASARGGLAATTLEDFVNKGFAEGTQGNAASGTEVRNIQIWASNPKNPAVRLVRSYLGRKTPVLDQPVDQPGVVVVLGPRFGGLENGRKAVRANGAFNLCVPAPAPASESSDPDA